MTGSLQIKGYEAIEPMNQLDTIGNLLQPDFVTHKFEQILTKYGLKTIRFHDVRHPNVKPKTQIFFLQNRIPGL